MTQSATTDRDHRRRRLALAFVTAVQVVAALYFLVDAVADLTAVRASLWTAIGGIFALGLGAGSVFSVRELLGLRQRLITQEHALATAAGALGRIIEAQFTAWALTPAEREIGFLMLKGFGNTEIAGLRDAAPGTVRAQMTRIYAKAGVSGRAQFAAFFVEDLLVAGVDQVETAMPRPARAAE